MTTIDPSHLTAAAAELLSESNPIRIGAILGERWVHYPRAGHVLQILNRLLDHPRTTRMPSIAVYGDSGMGKTMIMEKFRREHPALFDGGVVRADNQVGGERQSGWMTLGLAEGRCVARP